ncbi:MAG: hypothetical protein U0821_23375 [Chloroflexota bacterium]
MAPDRPYRQPAAIRRASEVQCEAVLTAIACRTGIDGYRAVCSDRGIETPRPRYFDGTNRQWETANLLSHVAV